MKQNFASLALASIGAIALVGCGAKNGAEDVVATVNGDRITQEEFHKYLERKPTVQVMTNQGAVDAGVAASLGFQALRDLVNRRLLLQLAKDEQVYPTNADIAKELDFQTKRRPDFVRALTAQGMTLDMIRQDLAIDLSRERILTKGITVSMDEVNKFIKDNPSKFSVPAQALLLYVVAKDPKTKAQVDRELATGKSFRQVATQYSQDPNARRNNGQFPETIIDRMPPRLQAIVKKTPELKSTDWLQDGSQWVKFWVDKKMPSKMMTIDDTTRTWVQRQLAIERGTRGTDLGKRLQAKLKKSKVDVALASLKEPWKRAFDTLQAQDNAAQTRTATSQNASK